MSSATPIDSTLPANVEEAAPVSKRRWFALVAVSLGVASTILNATVSNVAIPSIAADIGLTTADATWVNAAYALTFASLLLLSGRVADLVGRRRMFITGVIIFSSASVLIALSSSVGALVGARVVQGVGAAMIFPASLSLLNAVFRGRDRAIAFAVWGSIIGGVSAMGPLIGGWIIQSASWEWAFLINVPIGILTLFMALRFVPDSRDTSGERGLDIVGALLATSGVALLVFGIIEGQAYGWLQAKKQFTLAGINWPFEAVSPSAAALAASAGLIVSFIVLERRRAAAHKAVLLDLSLFDVLSFRYGSLVGLIVSLGEFGLLFALPLFLQSVYGYSALGTGFVLVSLAIGAFVASGLSAPLSQRIGPVIVLRIGMVFEVVGIIGLGFALTPTGSGWQLVPWLLLYGIGVGFATSQLAGISLSQVPVEQSGQASGAQSTARQMGAAIGTAVLGATLLAGLGATTGALTDRGVDPVVAASVTEQLRSTAGTAVPRLAAQPDGATLVEGASVGFASAVQMASFVAAGAVAVGLFATFLLPTSINTNARRRRPEDEPTDGDQGPDDQDPLDDLGPDAVEDATPALATTTTTTTD